MLREIGVFQPTGTVNEKTPAQFLNKVYSALSENCQFIDEMLQNRLGVAKWINQELSGAVLLQKQIDFPDNTRYYIALTPKDIYYLDTETNTFKFLTPTYTTGTVTFTQGSKTVEGAGGMLWSANVKAGDYIRKDGLNDAGGVWYEIDSITDNDTLVLKTAYAGTTVAGASYTVRKVFIGDRTDYWRYIRLPDENLGTIYAFTNGVDNIIYWDGDITHLAVSLTDIPIAKFIAVLNGRVVLFNVTEGGEPYPDMVRWSDPFDITSFPEVNYKQMPEVKGKIIGLGELAESLLLFWERAYSLFYYIGGEYTFANEFLNKNLGTIAPSSIITTSEGVKWVGEDLKLHLYDSSTEKVVGDELSTKFKNITPTLKDYIVGAYFPTLQQARWLMPIGDVSENSQVIMHDETYQTFHPFLYQNGNIFCSFGEYLRIDDLYLDDTVWGEKYVDEEDGFWDDAGLLANAPMILMGGTDGYIYQADTGLDDDGETYESILAFKKFDADLPSYIKRWFKVQPYFKTEASGNAYVSVKEDDDVSYSEEQEIDLAQDGDVIKPMLIFDANSVTLQPKFRIANPFRLLGFVLHFSTKNRVK